MWFDSQVLPEILFVDFFHVRVALSSFKYPENDALMEGEEWGGLGFGSKMSTSSATDVL